MTNAATPPRIAPPIRSFLNIAVGPFSAAIVDAAHGLAAMIRQRLQRGEKPMTEEPLGPSVIRCQALHGTDPGSCDPSLPCGLSWPGLNGCPTLRRFRSSESP